MFCKNCGNEVNEKAVICVKCGCSLKEETKLNLNVDTKQNKWIALALWIFLGALGAHHFYTRNNSRGVWYIVGVCTWIGIPVVGICLIIDLINILQGELNGVKLNG